MTTTHIGFELITFTFVSNSGDGANDTLWNGTADVDYNLFNILRLDPDFTNISAGETGSGI